MTKILFYHVQAWDQVEQVPKTLCDEEGKAREFATRKEASIEAFNVAQALGTVTQVFGMRLLKNPTRLEGGHHLAEYRPIETDEQAAEVKFHDQSIH
jgi:hypothetical protein